MREFSTWVLALLLVSLFIVYLLWAAAFMRLQAGLMSSSSCEDLLTESCTWVNVISSTIAPII